VNIVQRVLLAGEHQVGHQQRDAHRQRRVGPPQRMGQPDRRRAPARHAEQHQAVEQHRQAHGDGAEEHRLHRVLQHRPHGVAEQAQARGEQQGKQAEQADVEQPQPLGQRRLAGQAPRQAGEHQGEHPGAHGHGEPIGGELADEGQRLGQAGEGSGHGGSGRAVP
jgi:hypothetical protein